MRPSRCTALPLLLVAVLAAGCLGDDVGTGLASSSRAAGPPRPAAMPTPWPPRLGETYPDLELLDSAGKEVRISSLIGRVVLIEPIGMNCPACNAFAGGNRPGKGGLHGMEPEGGMPSIEEMIEQYAPGVRLDDPDLVLLHLLLYDYTMGPPDVEDARIWDEHFEVAKFHGRVVVPAYDLRGAASYKLVPGFQLIDRRGVLRFDAAGHTPVHSIWDELLPAIPVLLAEAR